MLKKYANTAFFYAILGPLLGVFYREYTKFTHFSGKTTLSVLHTHALVLGMVGFLLVLLLEKAFAISQQKTAKAFYITYNIGILMLIGTLIARGIQQVAVPEASSALNGAIAGIAGIGHGVLMAGIILLFLSIKASIKNSQQD